MADDIRKFGRYFLLDRIAQGGMAEIYRACKASIDGAGHILVIKRIQAGFGENSDFLGMFKSETRVTMGFNHPNIVQVFDFGEESNQPFIAMEYVEGKNARQFISRFAGTKQPFAFDYAAGIIEQAAAGLHYAHMYRDKITGEPIHVVHRDISPQNILISYDGLVKIVDFGIAKANTNEEATRAGVIKGKPSYLSPEQINGDVLDPRSDVFSLGIVFWELLTGKKLFASPSGENEFAVFKMIESCDTYVRPPSLLNPNVPKDLDNIVLKALTKDREQRYQSADELRRAIVQFLRAHVPDYTSSDLSDCVRSLFKADIVEDRKKLQALNAHVESLLQADEPPEGVETFGTRGSIVLTPDQRPTGEAGIKGEGLVGAADRQVDFDPNKSDEVEIEDTSGSGMHRTRQGSYAIGSSKANLRRLSAIDPTRMVPRPKYEEKKEPKKGFGTAIVKVAIFVGVAMFGIIIYGPSLLDMFATNDGGGGTPGSDHTPNPNATGRVEPGNQSNVPVIGDVADGRKRVLLIVELKPNSAKRPRVMLNGIALSSNNPIARVPLDQPVRLEARAEDYRYYKKDFVLREEDLGSLDEWSMEVKLEPKDFGFVTIHTTPSATAYFYKFDPKTRKIATATNPIVLQTPFENEKVPVGTYAVLLKNAVLGMQKKIFIKIRDGKLARVDERLVMSPDE